MGVKEILEELYQLDPELKTREDELMDILKKLMKAKPEAEPDEAFKARLKEELLAKMATSSKKKNRGLLIFTNPKFYTILCTTV